MSDESDIDELAHEQLLRSIKDGHSKQKSIRKTIHKVDAKDLLSVVKTERKSLSVAKKKIEDEEKKRSKNKSTTAIAAPIHRQELERIQGEVGLVELKKDLQVWREVVESNRLADQLSFPLNQEKVLSSDTASMKVENFKPKTDMEKELAALVQTSKHNLTNETIYTPAELEIIKAMNVKEAKARLDSLQRMRALISYREAKFRYAAKIKSKGYHRLLKRQKRKQLVKEFDELLIKDPEAAKEKLKELDTQRILERGSLKHHARSKFQQEILKHAGRDPAAKKVLEEHLRLGRELREKITQESDSENEDEGEQAKSVADLIKSAALAAAQSDEPSRLAFDEEDEAVTKQKLYEMRAAKRASAQASKIKSDGTIAKVENVFEEDNAWDEPVVEKNEEPTKLKTKKKTPKKRKLEKNLEEAAAAENETEPVSVKDVDQIFEEGTDVLIKKMRDEFASEKQSATPLKKKKKKVVKKTDEEPKVEEEVDVTLDPKHFLQVETSKIMKVAADMDDQLNELEDEDQSKLIAEAFKDEDVIGEFEEEKERVEEGEKGKDIDLTLKGWGSWTGPGTTENKRRKQFIIKAAEKKRKDKGKSAVIIKEKAEHPINKMQPRNLPFPYTRVVDYQTVLNQPIGKDYNPTSVTRDLCKPSVVTQGGRSIRPMDKKETIKKTIYESDDE